MTQVVHLQTHLPSSGNAAYRLHLALKKAGIGSTVLSLSSDFSQTGALQHLGKLAKLKSVGNEFLQSYLTYNANPQFGMFSYPLIGSSVVRHPSVASADIIYIHWAIGGFLSFSSIEQLLRSGKQIIMFMHDMWNITGGCHYSFACDKFKTSCSNCQLVPPNGLYDLAQAGFLMKKKLFEKYNNVHFVSPSKWLYQLAIESGITAAKPIHHIPNILPTEVFKPIDKSVARELLGVDPHDKVIAFGAASISSPYKGWGYLLEALELVFKQHGEAGITVLVFGNGNEEQIASAIPFKTRFLGRLRDDFSTALVYNAADLFLAPSLADNLPTTIMESLACGTPVVGFNTGGIPDMVKHLQNGYLADYRSAADLAKGILYCLDIPIAGFLSEEFNTDRLLQKHFDLYELLLKQSPVCHGETIL
jgi:glycosyltransferase involved in cell wall biosynthesis